MVVKGSFVSPCFVDSTVYCSAMSCLALSPQQTVKGIQLTKAWCCTMFLSATGPGIQSHRGGNHGRPHNRPLSTSRNYSIVAFINVNIGVARQPFWNVFASCCVWMRSQLTEWLWERPVKIAVVCLPEATSQRVIGRGPHWGVYF